MIKRPFTVRRSWAALAAICAISLSTASHAESVVFSGVEGSSNSSYAYLGAVIPLQGESLGNGWYRKAVISTIHYQYESTERGAAEDIHGRMPGIEAGFGRSWQFDERRVDVSATVGYRHIRLSPFEPKDEKTGNVITLNPQLIAYMPLSRSTDVDLMANHSIGLGSSFARLRMGYRPTESWRTGVETKLLKGDSYEIHTAGLFLAIPVSAKSTLEFNVGREKPRDDPSVIYSGIAFSTVF